MYELADASVCAGDRKPVVDDEGLVHWPVMFVYPETMQTDAVEDFAEADSLQQHLDIMFSADAPPLDWDEDHAYTRDRLELYYLSHAAKPLPLDQLVELSCFSPDVLLLAVAVSMHSAMSIVCPAS